jgi:hypothetical protein
MAQSPHKKRMAAQLVKKLPYFMEHEGSLPCSKSSPPVPRMWPIINPVHTIHPSVFISILLYAPKRTTCPTHWHYSNIWQTVQITNLTTYAFIYTSCCFPLPDLQSTRHCVEHKGAGSLSMQCRVLLAKRQCRVGSFTSYPQHFPATLVVIVRRKHFDQHYVCIQTNSF